MPFAAHANSRISYPIVQPTVGAAAPLHEEYTPTSKPKQAASLLDAVGVAAQKCLLAGASCVGAPGSRQRAGFFEGVVADSSRTGCHVQYLRPKRVDCAGQNGAQIKRDFC